MGGSAPRAPEFALEERMRPSHGVAGSKLTTRPSQTLTVVMPQVLISPAVSGKRPGLPFVALTELYDAVLVQLHPGALRVDHLPQERHSLSALTHVSQLKH